jgi:Copper transport outer membrane protein, MctB
VFDFRYHVVSLAAVFLALVLGILVGVAISDPGLADRTDKQNLRDEIARLEGQLEDASARERSDRAARAFADDAYDVVMEGRLRGVDVGILVVGQPDDAVVDQVTAAITDAGGDLVRMRALRVPVSDGLSDELAPSQLGRELGEEFVAGGETPMWDDLSSELVLERDGSFELPAQAVVVVRTVAPQRHETARMLRGLYEGIRGSVPAAGAESSTTEPSAVEVWDAAGLSVVDNVDTPVGRVSLAVVLGGTANGHFGVKDGARALVPPIPLLTPPPEETGG